MTDKTTYGALEAQVRALTKEVRFCLCNRRIPQDYICNFAHNCLYVLGLSPVLHSIIHECCESTSWPQQH